MPTVQLVENLWKQNGKASLPNTASAQPCRPFMGSPPRMYAEYIPKFSKFQTIFEINIVGMVRGSNG
jgi:hypothetical protein